VAGDWRTAGPASCHSLFAFIQLEVGERRPKLTLYSIVSIAFLIIELITATIKIFD
jgi:hypothetical protein